MVVATHLRWGVPPMLILAILLLIFNGALDNDDVPYLSYGVLFYLDGRMSDFNISNLKTYLNRFWSENEGK